MRDGRAGCPKAQNHHSSLLESACCIPGLRYGKIARRPRKPIRRCFRMSADTRSDSSLPINEIVEKLRTIKRFSPELYQEAWDKLPRKTQSAILSYEEHHKPTRAHTSHTAFEDHEPLTPQQPWTPPNPDQPDIKQQAQSLTGKRLKGSSNDPLPAGFRKPIR